MARPYPYEEFLECHCQAQLKQRIVEKAIHDQIPVGEVVVRLLCAALVEPPEFGLIPRKAPGRKPGGIKRRAKTKERG